MILSTPTPRAAVTAVAIAGLAALGALVNCRDAARDAPYGADGPTRGLRLEECRVRHASGRAWCGRLLVPEDRAIARGRQLALRVVVLAAHDAAARRPDPIVLLTGGPGLGAAADVGAATALDAARRDRDIVLLDQRGTGDSAPLTCDLYGERPAAFLGRRFPAPAVRACRAALERRADLTQYTTLVAVEDLDALRAALGYERMNLVGLSYGTKVALVYARHHATRVRSLVLDGVVTTDYPTPLPGAEGGDRALRRVFTDCAAEPACHRAYPDVAGDFRATVARFAGGRTVPVTLTRRLGLVRDRVDFTRRAFLDAVWSLLYTAGGARQLPRALHDAARGDLAGFARQAADRNRTRWPRFAAGAFLSVVCTEDVPFITPDALARADVRSLVGAPLAAELVTACAEWPGVALPAGYRAAVRSDAPALILSGELDPITPPEWAAEAARTLPNARHVVRPFAGHVDADGCTLDLMSRFIAHPDPAALDTSCIRGARRPPFRVD